MTFPQVIKFVCIHASPTGYLYLDTEGSTVLITQQYQTLVWGIVANDSPSVKTVWFIPACHFDYFTICHACLSYVAPRNVKNSSCATPNRRTLITFALVVPACPVNALCPVSCHLMCGCFFMALAISTSELPMSVSTEYMGGHNASGQLFPTHTNLWLTVVVWHIGGLS